ncbi:MAG: LytTR family transcriptional regulator [Defluviitaleaceae bacterium]|nr:LytTR family transcriptional regulator [Defluviitaleaceae bacterium]
MMKIVIVQPQMDEDEQIIVKCHHITPEIMRLLSAFKSQTTTLIGYIGSEICRINAIDVFYIEAVDNRVFLYSEQSVHESKQKLYEFEEELAHGDFLRISKSVIINLSKIKSLVPSLYGRLEAILENGEKVIISRQYVGELKKKLGI